MKTGAFTSAPESPGEVRVKRPGLHPVRETTARMKSKRAPALRGCPLSNAEDVLPFHTGRWGRGGAYSAAVELRLPASCLTGSFQPGRMKWQV